MPVLKRLQQPLGGIWNNFKELTGTQQNNAISVFGGVTGSATVTANSTTENASATTGAFYHSYAQMNVAGTVGTLLICGNRLSAIEFHHKAAGASEDLPSLSALSDYVF